MNMLLTTTAPQWAAQLADRQGHLLQSWPWGEFKSHFGWTPYRIQVDGAAAQVLFRRLPLGFTVAYIPKGPLLDWTDLPRCQQLFSAIHNAAKKQRAVFLKVEPNVWCDNDQTQMAQATQSYLHQAQFSPADTIQPQSSILIDISGDEAAVLAAMKQKTRYNIRLAERKGVIVRQGQADDLPAYYQLSQLTADRDGFGVHGSDYYRLAYEYFAPDHCALFIAEFEDQPLAALMVFRQGTTAYYLYGASSNSHRNLMAPYLVQWAAIRWAKAQGCTDYDLWGIPNADPAALEAEFANRQDGLWGVYRFKRGFGGQIYRSIGAYDYVYNPLLYKMYQLRRGSTPE